MGARGLSTHLACRVLGRERLCKRRGLEALEERRVDVRRADHGRLDDYATQPQSPSGSRTGPGVRYRAQHHAHHRGAGVQGAPSRSNSARRASWKPTAPNCAKKARARSRAHARGALSPPRPSPHTLASWCVRALTYLACAVIDQAGHANEARGGRDRDNVALLFLEHVRQERCGGRGGRRRRAVHRRHVGMARACRARASTRARFTPRRPKVGQRVDLDRAHDALVRHLQQRFAVDDALGRRSASRTACRFPITAGAGVSWPVHRAKTAAATRAPRC